MIHLAEIHPMLVHFPIVFTLLAWVLLLVALLLSESHSLRHFFIMAGFFSVILSGLSAIVAATFGDMALDIAGQSGFKNPSIEIHQGLGIATTVILALNACMVIYCLWRKVRLDGSRNLAGIFAFTSIGLIMVVITAYYGGYLVYGLGVNVLPVHP